MHSTHRGVEIDEDRAGHIFAAGSLGEESLVGAGLANVGGIGVDTTVCLEAVLQQVPMMRRAQYQFGGGSKREKR